MSKTPKQFRQGAWDATNAKYAPIGCPEWAFMKRLPAFFWEDETNHKRYMKWLGRKLGIKSKKDWYNVSSKDFLDHRGQRFLDYYDHSHIAAIMHHFPRFDWKPWFFRQTPNGYWKKLDNCATYVRWFEEQKDFTDIEDWYGVTQNDVYAMNGCGLMDRFACSVQQLINAVYPEHDWKPWLFVQVPKHFWPKRKNRVAYMKWLGSELGYKRAEDWYRVSRNELLNNHGGSLIQFGYKTIDLVRELYPDRKWYPWMFTQVSPGFWNRKSNRVEYLKWLGNQLGFKNADDWRKVKRQDFTDNYGHSVFNEYFQGNSCKAVKELYPKSNFMPWEFHQVPSGFWDEPSNCRSYLRWLGKRLGFAGMKDWYRVRRADFYENLGNGFIKRFRTPYKGLKIAYPNYKWIPWLFENVPVGFWSKSANRFCYLEWLGKKLKFKTPNDWMSLTTQQLRANKGSSLIRELTVLEIRKAGQNLEKSKANRSRTKASM